MDLIVGLPEEGLEDVKATMEEIRRLDPDGLTVPISAAYLAVRSIIS